MEVGFQPEEMESSGILMPLTLIPPVSLTLHFKTLILMENDYLLQFVKN